MYAMDTTIANIVLPQLQGSLQASQEQIAWVLTSYIVVSAIFTPLLSPLSERFGVAHVLMGGIVMFTIASLLCGLATTLPEMVTFRILQGASGAALIPLSQSILLNAFPRERHAAALAVWGVGVMIGPIIGPTLGGYLTDQFNWRWVFLINLPVGILALLGIAATVPREKPQAPRHFNAFGYLLLAGAIGMLQLFLDRGNVKDWFNSSEILVEAGLAGLFLYLFVAHSLMTRHPFYSPALFRDRNFVLGSFLICMVLVGLFATMALMPLFLQRLQGYTVFEAGLLLAPRGVGMAAMSFVVGKFLHDRHPRYLISCGLMLVAASTWWVSEFNLDVSWKPVAASGVLQGMGVGLIVAPLMAATFATLEQSLRVEATALYAVLRNLGGGIGISLAFTVLARSTQANHARLVEHLSVLDVAKWQALRAVFGGHAEAVANLEVSRQAAMLAFIVDFKLLFLVTLAGIPMVFLMRRAR
jgi:DHA2 family multidrug resistance protein